MWIRRWTGLSVLVLLMGVRSGLAADRPNIFFAISDDQSYPDASAYGCKYIDTPAFDRVADQGVLFTQAFAASPGCSPSRASVLMGRYPWQLEHAGTHGSEFSPKYVTFPDLLEQAGYVVGFTGKGWGPGDWSASGRPRNPAGPEFSQITHSLRGLSVSPVDYAENFRAFLKQRKKGQPFCFWYGGKEPHRTYAKDSGLRAGKKAGDVTVPSFLPDRPEIRNDLLDYGLEIEWFDGHLGRMLNMLEAAGELDNTLIIVTGDNGMPFPRAKANCYEYGIHVPLAIRWPAKVKGGRVVEDLVSFVDLTATILEAAGVKHPAEASGPYPMVGKSILDILTGQGSGLVDSTRQYVFSARERHSSSRYNNLAYPQRAIRSQQYLYIRNFKPDRWPAGAPQKYEEDGTLGPMHGAYHDIDPCPALTFLVEHRDDREIAPFFHAAVDKRPAEEFFDIRQDPGCMKNLAGSSEVAEAQKTHREALDRYLLATKDPRMGPNGDVFEGYRRFANIRKFPKPE
jgi:uncharacterized sulfatase